MTKRDLVVKIAADTNLIQSDVAVVVQKTLDYIADELVEGRDIELRNFVCRRNDVTEIGGTAFGTSVINIDGDGLTSGVAFTVDSDTLPRNIFIFDGKREGLGRKESVGSISADDAAHPGKLVNTLGVLPGFAGSSHSYRRSIKPGVNSCIDRTCGLIDNIAQSKISSFINCCNALEISNLAGTAIHNDSGFHAVRDCADVR